MTKKKQPKPRHYIATMEQYWEEASARPKTPGYKSVLYAPVNTDYAPEVQAYIDKQFGDMIYRRGDFAPESPEPLLEYVPRKKTSFEGVSDEDLAARHKSLEQELEDVTTKMNQTEDKEQQKAFGDAYFKLIDEKFDAWYELRARNVPGFRLEDVPPAERIHDSYRHAMFRLDDKQFNKLTDSEQKVRQFLFETDFDDSLANDKRWLILGELNRLHDVVYEEYEQREASKEYKCKQEQNATTDNT